MPWESFHHSLAGVHHSTVWATVNGKTQALLQHDSFALRHTPTLHLDGWITCVVCAAVKKIWAVALILRNQEKAGWSSPTWWKITCKTTGWRELFLSWDPWCSPAMAVEKCPKAVIILNKCWLLKGADLSSKTGVEVPPISSALGVLLRTSSSLVPPVACNSAWSSRRWNRPHGLEESERIESMCATMWSKAQQGRSGSHC